MCYDYYVRDLPDDKSITNNVNVRFLSDLMDSYIYARQCTERFSKDIQTISVNPSLNLLDAYMEKFTVYQK